MKNKEDNFIIESEEKDSPAVSISPEKLEVKKHGSLVVGTLNLALNPLKKRNEMYYRGNPWYLVVDIVILFLLAALALFIFFNTNWGPAKRVELSLNTSSENISSGSSLSLDLNYHSYVEAEDAMLYLSLPDNFIIESVQPANLFLPEKNAFNLAHIEDGMHGKIKINGLVWGDSSQQKIKFNLRCSSCGKNGVSNTFLLNIDQKALDVKIETDNKVYANSEFEGQITLKNNTNNDLNDIYLDLGPDIELRQSDKSIIDHKIKIDHLRPGEESKFSFFALTTKNDIFKIQSNFNLKIKDNEFSFSGKEKEIAIKEADLNLEIKSNAKNVDNGEKINYSLSYENKGEEAKNLIIKLSSNNPNFSLASLQVGDLGDGFRLEGNSILIDTLKTKESGQINLSASYKQHQFLSNQELALKAELSYQSGEQQVKHNFISNKNRLNSQVSASASAYYYSPQGDQLGVGPLPPAVNMSTKYWVLLELNLLGNDLDNVSLSAELAKNVSFSDNKRVLNGDLKYGEIGKRLIWELGSISGPSNKYRANFEISLSPDEQDLGKVLNLLEKIELRAHDKFTGEEINLNIANIDTNLKNDKLSSGKGQVVSF